MNDEMKYKVYTCVKNFQEESNQLVQMMLLKPGIELNKMEDWFNLMRITDRGNLSADWEYWLHGIHCSFRHSHTKQMIEVTFEEHPAFGHAEPCSLLTYMASTPQYHELADYFNGDFRQLAVALDVLADEGLLRKETLGNSMLFLAR